jgi:hypothetical protein
MEEMAYTIDNLIPIKTSFSISLPSRHTTEISQFPIPVEPERALTRGLWLSRHQEFFGSNNLSKKRAASLDRKYI